MSSSVRLLDSLRATTADEITIDAPADRIWAVYTDVERWPEWTASVTSAQLDPPGPLSIGTRARIKQPRFLPVTWIVTELQAGHSWTWANRSPGATTIAHHVLTTIAEGRVHVQLSIEQRGVLGRPVGWVVRRLTRKYLRLEAEGLRRRSEASPDINGG